MIVAAWVVAFAGLVLAASPRTLLLLWASLAAMVAMVASIGCAAVADPTPWGMDPAVAMLITLFGVPLTGLPTGTLARQVLTGSPLDPWNPDGTDGFDALAGNSPDPQH